MRIRVPAFALAIGLASCGYYNGMWSADHYARTARSAERGGREDEARTAWGMAAVKAESVVAHHPHGKWADPALVLEGEALGKTAACDQATPLLERAIGSVRREDLRERAALAAADCALQTSRANAAETLAAEVTESKDAARAASARYLAGRAAEQLGDLAAAAVWYGRSSAPAAATGRVRVLLASGQTNVALASLDTVARAPFVETEWNELIDNVARAVGADSASRALTTLLTRRHVSAGSRARLLLADGDRLFAAGATVAAGARYQEVRALVPDSVAGQRSRVRLLLVQAAKAESLADLNVVDVRLTALTQSGLSGLAAADAHALEGLLQGVSAAGDGPDAAIFHAAELARDSLSAPHLATSLFCALARRRPGSLFAPKAIVAASALAPERRDSLLTVLQTAYAGSPYTLAVQGDVSPGFAAAEDSLGRALGVAVAAPVAIVSRVSVAVPGPRGPPTDDALAPADVEKADEAAPPPGPGRAAGRATSTGRRPAARPVGRPAEQP